MSEVNIAPILAYLKCPTPQAWIEKALQEPEILLLDHAANELKAAQAAMTLMARNPTKIDLLNKMSRLAREELVHFESVLKILKKRHMNYRPLKASRYAGWLGKAVRPDQNGNLTDTLVVGSIIEARSCERFAALAPYLDPALQKFYLSLLKSEARHYQDYLTLAASYAEGGEQEVDERVALFLTLEQETIETPDRQFRFHSGVPVE